MRIAGKKNKSIRSDSLLLISQVMAILLLAGCGANYGSLIRDPEVQQAFETQRVPPEYIYYYYGFSTRPYVVFGIEPVYIMDSRMWKQVSPDTAEFKEMIRWIWEDYGYVKFGADILDPSGKKAGIMYTAIDATSVKFGPDHHIAVMPNLPFLGGPDGNIEDF